MTSIQLADENRDRPTRTGHHPEKAIGAGWENDELIAVTTTGSYGGPPSDELTRPHAQEIIAGFLRLITDGASALMVGQRVLMLAYLAGQSDCKTHAEFADRLKVTPGRVSQILRTIPPEFAALARLKARTVSARPVVVESDS